LEFLTANPRDPDCHLLEHFETPRQRVDNRIG
jgi:hypothetical protein